MHDGTPHTKGNMACMYEMLDIYGQTLFCICVFELEDGGGHPSRNPVYTVIGLNSPLPDKLLVATACRDSCEHDHGRPQASWCGLRVRTLVLPATACQPVLGYLIGRSVFRNTVHPLVNMHAQNTRRGEVVRSARVPPSSTKYCGASNDRVSPVGVS